MIAHDPSLVILSITIAILGTFTASVMTSNVGALSRGEGRMRIVMAAVTLGGCIWAMNFVGLLSMEVPVNLSYDPLMLGVSAAVSFIGTATALFLLWPKGDQRGTAAAGDRPVRHCDFRHELPRHCRGRGPGVELSWFLAVDLRGVCHAERAYVARVPFPAARRHFDPGRRYRPRPLTDGRALLGHCLSPRP